ncbi:hypothetical protein DRE_03336 [Drechslerella stenobrocha 248]|uniref:Uncharacterized protein n=1 Tax=Drechslerella stenobrocha 248 TaxID=1043628 RepID=W7I456_9PEZI|nr:hypothetical protein DRE_03336 [Drechslerella stenobrocha 248]
MLPQHSRPTGYGTYNQPAIPQMMTSPFNTNFGPGGSNTGLLQMGTAPMGQPSEGPNIPLDVLAWLDLFKPNPKTQNAWPPFPDVPLKVQPQDLVLLAEEGPQLALQKLGKMFPMMPTKDIDKILPLLAKYVALQSNPFLKYEPDELPDPWREIFDTIYQEVRVELRAQRQGWSPVTEGPGGYMGMGNQ